MIEVSSVKKRLLWLVGFVLLSTPAFGQTVGYAHRSGEVYRLDLDSGSAIAWQVISETDLGGITGAFARSPDGRLFGANSWWPNDDRLYILEPSTGDVEFVGPLSDGGIWLDLAFDDLERLWMVDGGLLHLVDTSDAATTPMDVGEDSLLAVGFHAGRLYAIAGEDLTESFQLLEIDPDAGTSQLVAELPGYVQSSCSNEWPTGMTFDADGGLWVVVVEWQGTCILPFPTVGYQYYPDPWSGSSGLRRHLAGGGPGLMPGLAVLGGPAVVDIPTLSPVGALGLAALLSIVGLRMVRRRNR